MKKGEELMVFATGSGRSIAKRDYIETISGQKVYMPNPDPDSIRIGDIAHALSFMARFAGHTRYFYSVAEHSINVASIVPPEHQLQALLHDATEAYLCDIPTPFKRMIPEYQALEENLWAAISEKFGVPFELSPEVKWADRVMLMTERDALKDRYDLWSDEYEETERVPFKRRNWDFAQCAKQFKRKFYDYGGKL